MANSKNPHAKVAARPPAFGDISQDEAVLNYMHKTQLRHARATPAAALPPSSCAGEHERDAICISLEQFQMSSNN